MLGRRHGDISVSCLVGTGVLALIGEGEAGIGGRAALESRGRVTRFDLVGFMPRLGPEREVQRSGEADVELMAQIEIRRQLGGDETSYMKIGGRKPVCLVKVGVR